MQPALSTLPNSGLPLAKKPVEDQLVRAAGLMITTPKGEALFLRYVSGHENEGEWAWPAGEMEDDEEAETAAIRETREETGWIPTGEVVEVASNQDEVDFTTFGTITQNQFIPELSDEHDSWCWAPLDNPPEPLHPGVNQFLLDHISAASPQDLLAQDKEFREEDHPRDHGKFTSGGGSKTDKSDRKTRLGYFLGSSQAQQAVASATKKALGAAKEHHNQLLAGAVSFGLYHIIGADFPMDVEEALHHEVEHLATNLGVVKTVAIAMMKDAVSGLRKLRSSGAMDSEDDIDAALEDLEKVLDRLGRLHAQDEKVGKIDRSAFLYLEDPDESNFAQCKTCWLFDKPAKRCQILPDDFEVNAEDSCGYYLEGEFQLSDAPKVKPEDVGFVKATKVRCENCYYGGGNCKLYELLNSTFPNFFDLDTKINPRGCCNAFQSAE